MQQLHELAAEIHRLCRLVEREIREITLLNKRLIPIEMNQSGKIDRLSRRLDETDAKISLILARIQSIDQSIQSIQSNQSVAERRDEQGETSHRDILFQETTARERQVLGILFNYGMLSYREIAHYLNIAPSSVKGLVNRLLDDPKKSKLLIKSREGKELRIGLAPEIEQRILAHKKRRTNLMEAEQAI